MKKRRYPTTALTMERATAEFQFGTGAAGCTQNQMSGPQFITLDSGDRFSLSPLTNEKRKIEMKKRIEIVEKQKPKKWRGMKVPNKIDFQISEIHFPLFFQ